MTLLLDQNLSHKLVGKLLALYPGVQHVSTQNLSSADDRAIWSYAAENNLAIVSKDSDFHDLSTALGHPPKVIWLQAPYCTTGEIEDLLRTHQSDIQAFLLRDEASELIITWNSSAG